MKYTLRQHLYVFHIKYHFHITTLHKYKAQRSDTYVRLLCGTVEVIFNKARHHPNLVPVLVQLDIYPYILSHFLMFFYYSCFIQIVFNSVMMMSRKQREKYVKSIRTNQRLKESFSLLLRLVIQVGLMSMLTTYARFFVMI